MADPVKRAVVIGIDDYIDEDIKNLTGAVNDAQEIHERLAEVGDFELEEPLLNEAATDEAIRSAISRLLWETDPVDITAIYFSGHGFADSFGTGYLAPHNFIYTQPIVHGIDMAWIQGLARQAKNKSVVLTILDCCYAGISTGKGDPAQTASLKAGLQVIENEDEFEGKGRFVLASSGPSQQSRERSGQRHTYGPDIGDHVHGVFTYHLLEGLDGLAATANDEITLFDLAQYLRTKIDDADQRLTVSSAGAQGEVPIARSAKHQIVNQLLAESDQALAEGSTPNLFFGLSKLIEAADLAPYRHDVLELQERVIDRLEQEKGDANFVLLKMRPNLPLESRKVYDELESTLDRIEFERLMTMRPGMMGLIQLLWEVAEEAATNEKLEENIKAMARRSQRPPEVRTGSRLGSRN